MCTCLIWTKFSFDWATLRNVDSDKNLESLRSFDDFVEMVEYNETYTVTFDEDLFGPNVGASNSKGRYGTYAKNEQLVFIPHVTGFHWVLFVIDLSYPIVYYLDSLHGSVHQNLKLILSTAIKLGANAKNLKRILAWKEVEVYGFELIVLVSGKVTNDFFNRY
ncbi:hypothetical protein Vadar_011695 [Vaccinium darrowii]|uniref:Uncharacterized protein n=1 Tax=Vaccinium darrowii TaxID=229202 RepID=A0ACB7XYJ0_9ERIC|nr:hypothetical protein Vadar_011695 [Vaccinium darrowii]